MKRRRGWGRGSRLGRNWLPVNVVKENGFNVNHTDDLKDFFIPLLVTVKALRISSPGSVWRYPRCLQSLAILIQPTIPCFINQHPLTRK